MHMYLTSLSMELRRFVRATVPSPSFSWKEEEEDEEKEEEEEGEEEDGVAVDDGGEGYDYISDEYAGLF